MPLSSDRIVYQFYTDPFLGLRGHVAPEKLDAAYMKFKVDFLLGNAKTFSFKKKDLQWARAESNRQPFPCEGNVWSQEAPNCSQLIPLDHKPKKLFRKSFIKPDNENFD